MAEAVLGIVLHTGGAETHVVVHLEVVPGRKHFLLSCDGREVLKS